MVSNASFDKDTFLHFDKHEQTVCVYIYIYIYTYVYVIKHSNDVIATGRMFYKPVLLGSQWFCCRCLRSKTLFFLNWIPI